MQHISSSRLFSIALKQILTGLWKLCKGLKLWSRKANFLVSWEKELYCLPWQEFHEQNSRLTFAAFPILMRHFCNVQPNLGWWFRVLRFHNFLCILGILRGRLLLKTHTKFHGARHSWWKELTQQHQQKDWNQDIYGIQRAGHLVESGTGNWAFSIHPPFVSMTLTVLQQVYCLYYQKLMQSTKDVCYCHSASNLLLLGFFHCGFFLGLDFHWSYLFLFCWCVYDI